MKKNRTLIAILVAVMVAFGAYVPAGSTVPATAANTPVTPEVFTAVNGYLYNTGSHLNASPDSMEAWIKLPTTSLGGTIASNRIGTDDAGFPLDSVGWCIDVFGRPTVEWDDMQINVSFDSDVSLFDDEWHHIAIVRTNESFSYYLDGELESVTEVRSFPVYSQDSMNIGACNRGWCESRTTFEGYIQQFTMYEGAISQTQIKQDMSDAAISLGDVKDSDVTLLGSWNFGEQWTERTVPNSLEGGSDAVLHTQSKYVGVDWDFGEYDYTFAIVPDIQIMTHFNNERVNNMTRWMVNNKERINLQFAFFVGDLADTGGDPETDPNKSRSEYQAAQTAMDILNNKVPYCFVPGNHDYIKNFSTSALYGVRDTRYHNEFFPRSKHSQLPGFGGTFEPDKIENNYYTFDAMGVQYLVINLEFRTRPKVLRWANRVIEAHPQHRVIINRHDNLRPNRTFESNTYSYDGVGAQQMFDSLVAKHPNVFLNVGGHYPTDDIEYRIDEGEYGNQIISMLVDGQGTDYMLDDASSTAQDMFLLCFVSETNKTMTCIYYSPEKDMAWNIQNMFQLSISDANNPTIGA